VKDARNDVNRLPSLTSRLCKWATDTRRQFRLQTTRSLGSKGSLRVTTLWDDARVELVRPSDDHLVAYIPG